MSIPSPTVFLKKEFFLLQFGGDNIESLIQGVFWCTSWTGNTFGGEWLPVFCDMFVKRGSIEWDEEGTVENKNV